MRIRTRVRRSTILVVTLLLASVVFAAPAAVKKPITHDVYDSWRSIQNTALSRDGNWLVYTLQPQDGDGEIVARNLKTNAEYRHPRGKDGIISADGRHVVFVIAPPKADVDKAKKDKKKPEDQPKNGMGVLSLASGQVTAFERVKSFKLPAESGGFVAYLLEPAKKKPEPKTEEKEEKKEGEAAEKKKEKKKEPGSELVIRDLTSGTETKVAEVVEYAWNEPGSWLAYTVSSTTAASDGAFAWPATGGAARSLLAGQGHYQGLSFDKKGGQLAFLSDRDSYSQDQPTYKLYHWSTDAATAAELVSTATPGFRPNMVVSEHGRLEFSKDGARLFLGTALKPKPEPPDDAPEPIKVDIWHWKDPELQTMQKVRAEDEKKRNFRAVAHVADKRFTHLASADMPDLTVQDHANRALGASNLPYRQLVSWDGNYSDYFLVNLRDGSRMPILQKQQFGATLSPGAGFLLYFDTDKKAWLVYRMNDGRTIDLTGKLGVSFQDETWDTPNEPRPYGAAGWTDGDRSVLLYDRYDIWELRPDGSNARMITGGMGRKQKLVFRYQKLDDEEKTIPSDKPLLLSTRDDTTKASGFYRVALDKPAEPSRVIMLDKAFANPIKAKNADTLVYTLSRFEEFPNLWVSDASFSGMRQVSDANPQQAEYNWGRSELIDFRNTNGVPLRAILTRPEDFDPAKKYPLMVYIYEELTNGLHRHIPPSPGTSINITRYVSNGYVVLQPDIIYDTGYPGESSFRCVIPAVQAVLDMGFVDPQRIGIQGHSWGGYQISYLITRTNMFRAVQAGASVVNMTSAYGGIRWGSGMSRAFQYEKTQSRIGAPPWERPLQFIENSPLFWVEKVQTPYLTIHNDEDDAVPWYQGIEFFSALRRLGKEAYMFNYNTEKHGLRQREHQKHWTVHQDEFFDHFLKGAPKPEWMEKGVPYLERGTRDVTPLYKKSTEDLSAARPKP